MAFTCTVCGEAFEIPSSTLAKFPGWQPKYCRVHSPKKKKRAAARNAREENLTRAEVLAKYTDGPSSGAGDHTADVIALESGSIYTHTTGFAFRHPDDWHIVPDAVGLLLVPAEAATTFGTIDERERHLLLGNTAPIRPDVRSPEAVRALLADVRGLLPFLVPDGETRFLTTTGAAQTITALALALVVGRLLWRRRGSDRQGRH